MTGCTAALSRYTRACPVQVGRSLCTTLLTLLHGVHAGLLLDKRGIRHTFSENTSLSSTPCSEAQSRCFPFAKLGKSTTPSRKNSMLRFRADSLKCATARSRSMQRSNPRCNPMVSRHHSLRRGRHRRTNSRAHGWSAWAICDSSLVIIGSAANMDGAVYSLFIALTFVSSCRLSASSKHLPNIDQHRR